MSYDQEKKVEEIGEIVESYKLHSHSENRAFSEQILRNVLLVLSEEKEVSSIIADDVEQFLSQESYKTTTFKNPILNIYFKKLSEESKEKVDTAIKEIVAARSYWEHAK